MLVKLHRSVGMNCKIQEVIEDLAYHTARCDAVAANLSFIPRLQLGIKTKIMQEHRDVRIFLCFDSLILVRARMNKVHRLKVLNV